MKIIFSRKGFDSGYGRRPSPIFPDGRSVSLPIPVASRSSVCYRDVRCHVGNLGPVVEQLTAGKISANRLCHLDPDLVASALPRTEGWKPAFGQVGSAQSHLARQEIGPGDLFLFFGWFQPVEQHAADSWRYRQSAPSVHRLFGWLQVGAVHTVGSEVGAARRRWPWLAQHPHLNGAWNRNNTLYIANDRLTLAGVASHLSGANYFRMLSDALTLTAPGQPKRSFWRLPACFLPENGVPCLTYHGNPACWSRQGKWVMLQTVAKGQEFVLDTDDVPGVLNWLAKLFAPEDGDAENLSLRR